jgi:hypothetical protein
MNPAYVLSSSRTILPSRLYPVLVNTQAWHHVENHMCMLSCIDFLTDKSTVSLPVNRYHYLLLCYNLTDP